MWQTLPESSKLHNISRIIFIVDKIVGICGNTFFRLKQESVKQTKF